MKRWRFYAFLLLCAVFFSLSNAKAENHVYTLDSTFLLPDSLQIVGDEAFSGTAVETVIFPDGFLQIGERVFDKARHLTDVYIPKTTEYIADSAFPITTNLTIHGIDDSYAKDWAHRHEIPFVIDDIWNVFVLTGISHNTHKKPINQFISTIVLIIIFSFFRSCYFELRSRRPQDRPELYPIEYRFP